MNDPTRFKETEPDSAEAMLLRSMSRDEPASGSKKALLGALALGAVGGSAGTAAAAKAGSGTLNLGVAKWLGVVGVCGAALGIGYTAWKSRGVGSHDAMPPVVDVRDRSTPPAHTPTSQVPEMTPLSASQTGAEKPGESPSSRVTAAGDSQAAVARGRAEKSASIVQRPSASASSDARRLADEVAALERARRALGENDNAAALRTLSEYERQFTRRTLGPEAEVLRIEAMIGSGNNAAGKALGQKFLARHPNSPLAGRVRSLLGQSASSK